MSSAMIQTKFGAGSLAFDNAGETGCDSAAQQRLGKARIAKNARQQRWKTKLVFIAWPNGSLLRNLVNGPVDFFFKRGAILCFDFYDQMNLIDRLTPILAIGEQLSTIVTEDKHRLFGVVEFIRRSIKIAA